MRNGSVAVPVWLSRSAAISWRLLVVGAVVYFGFRILQQISVVVIASVLALFLGSVLWPLVRWLTDRNWPPALATLLVMIGAFAILSGLFFFVIPGIVSAFGNIAEDLQAAGDSVRDWLRTGPLGLSDTQIDDYWNTITERIGEFGSQSLLGGATAALELVSGFLLLVIVTFFVLKDGRRLTRMLVDRLPSSFAAKVETGISTGWQSLARYMRGLALVGLFDAVLIGVGLWIVGVPLVLPLATLVFLGAFVPLVGAFLSGLLAVAVAFVNGGPVDALIILAIVTAVQQIEGDVVLPVVFGQTLRIHPLLILLGVAGGGLAFGLIGAFLVVPAIAVVIAVHEALADEPDSSLVQLARG